MHAGNSFAADAKALRGLRLGCWAGGQGLLMPSRLGCAALILLQAAFATTALAASLPAGGSVTRG